MMPSRSRKHLTALLLAAATLVAPGRLLAQTPGADEPKPELTAATSEFDLASGDFVATGDARITYQGILLTADEIRLNPRTYRATAKGNVVISGQGVRLVGKSGTFDFRERRVVVDDFRAGSPPWLASAERAEGTLDALMLFKPRLFVGEPTRTGPVLRADTGTILAQQRVQFDNPVVALGERRGVPLPDVNRLLADPGVRARVRVGYKGDVGAYLRPEVTLPLNDSLSFVGGLEIFSRRGVLVAPGADYQGATESGTYSGSLRSGWIHDFGGTERRGRDLQGGPIERERGLVGLRHKQSWGEDQYLVADLNHWSDSEVTRDFRWESYRSLPQPDSWVEFGRKTGNHGLFSVFVRTRADDFQPVTQRLPEIRYDLLPGQIGESGFVHKGFLSGAYLRRTYNAPFIFDAFGDSISTESIRFDGYYGIERTFRVSDWASLTPVLGLRSTFDGVVGDDRDELALQRDSYQRALGVVGADLRLHAHAVHAIRSPVWKIDGLRHRVEPLIQYRYQAGSNSLPLRPTGATVEDIPLGLFEGELELDRMRDTDVISRSHLVRAGVHNSFQTRAPGGGSRDLAQLYVGQEYRPSGEEAAIGWNALFSEVRLFPASFLELGWTSRYSHDGGRVLMSNPKIVLKDGRRWRVSLANHYLEGLYNDYVFGGEVFLNEAWSVATRLRYDERGSRWREQTYLLRQTVDNTWRVEYRVTRSEGDTREDSFGFGVAVDLLSF